ncbi:hypothetical protein IV203_025606 [Nitzschia inconspicua]|uniref:Transmembrane protein n=1 Tax=Nitzschia inconspicua TaxID=303405 RepID=A0A9K3LGH8_9STRA|nr:hypothetical protein IV203_033417 [Nitzschia inconspicua]KAG7361940.1 hypothetical protein IV203_025606 [Nitzschia inconspicua]
MVLTRFARKKNKAAKVEEEVAAIVGRDGDEKKNHDDKKKKMTVMTKSPMSSEHSTVTPTVSESKDITHDERLVSNTVSFGDDDGKWENLSIPNVESASTTTPTSFTSTESDFVSSDEKQKDDGNDASSTMSPSLVSPSASSIVTQASSLPNDDLDEPFECENNEGKSDQTLNQVKRNDAYVSKEDLVLLLPSETYEEYESMIENEREQKHADQQMRKLLIQEELSNLLQRMRKMNEAMEDEPELEPEAEEALGIAANRVCYLQKYYDVASCDYVFVPSVAFALMNGSLLDEAAKHYNGKSEEFLVTYAATLGSAVLSLKDHKDLINVGINKESLSPKWNMAEDLDLTEDESPQQKVKPKNQSVSDLFFGVVSPRNLKDGSAPWSNTINSLEEACTEPKVGENNENTLPPTKNKKRMNRKIKLAIGIYIFLAVTFSCILLVLKPQFETNHTMDLEEIMTSSRPFELPTDFMPQSSGKTSHIQLTPRTTQDSSTNGMPTTRTTAETVPAVVSTQQQRTPISSHRTSSTRPIVANLLYYH